MLLKGRARIKYLSNAGIFLHYLTFFGYHLTKSLVLFIYSNLNIATELYVMSVQLKIETVKH